MKNLKKLEVRELNTKELISVDGGGIIDAIYSAAETSVTLTMQLKFKF